MLDPRPLLLPLALAQDALARLEATAAAASDAVQDGLRTRLAYREAAGWLAHQGHWIHPTDLALRDAGLTGSYTAASLGHRLPSVLPATHATAEDTAAPDDQDVALALTIARLWRRLGELRTWLPLDQPFGPVAIPDLPPDLPPLLRAGLLIRDAARSDRLHPAAVFQAACLWRSEGAAGALPLWSAPVQQLHRLALHPRATWLIPFLGCIAAAAGQGRQELARLCRAEARAATLPGTARSRLPDAAAAALRRPVLTARLLAEDLHVTPRAALDLLGKLAAAGVLREATGRAAWRAYIVV